MGAVVLTWNLPALGSTQLKLDASAIADIFLGHITKWNDKRLTSLNPGVNLPNADIIVVHRSDGSGTSYIFTDYLSKVSTEWKEKVGYNTSVNWPAGLGGKGNEGVTQQVKQVEGAIGYVELIYAVANKLPYALVKNAAGILRRSLPGERHRRCGLGEVREEHRLPGVHHQCARQGCLPDFLLYLVAGSPGREGPGQGQGNA